MYGVRDVFGDSDDDIDDNRPIHQVGDTDDDGDGEDGANGCSRDDSDDSVACVDPPTLSDKQRKGGRPTRKGQRSTSPRAGAAGCPVDLAREQRGEEGATRKKASKGASGDPLDVDSGVSEQPAPRGKKKASVKTRKAGGKKKAPANTKKTAGKKMSEPVSEFESESESDTTRTLRSARRKVTPEQRKNLTEMSKSTCPDRIKERDAAFAAHNESLRRGRGRLSWPRKALRKKGEAKSATVAAQKARTTKETPAPTAARRNNDKNVKAPPGTKKPAATLGQSAAKSKKILNKAAPGTNKPAERAAPAAANLDPSKNDQASKGPVSASPSNKSGREEKKTRDDTTSTANRRTASGKSYVKKLLAKQNAVESGDSEEADADESVDELEDARAEPHGDLESDDSQGAGDGSADEGEDPPLDHFGPASLPRYPGRNPL
ncbi:expressed unknown protein [Ectocarpus siliculosus]|nr:expressed unknown protein [Ectocarpus siliculosus]|eukprot:CBJ34113.1 expressed unknown protein [Ectocarpus siliculosus]